MGQQPQCSKWTMSPQALTSNSRGIQILELKRINCNKFKNKKRNQKRQKEKENPKYHKKRNISFYILSAFQMLTYMFLCIEIKYLYMFFFLKKGRTNAHGCFKKSEVGLDFRGLTDTRLQILT